MIGLLVSICLIILLYFRTRMMFFRSHKAITKILIKIILNVGHYAILNYLLSLTLIFFSVIAKLKEVTTNNVFCEDGFKLGVKKVYSNPNIYWLIKILKMRCCAVSKKPVLFFILSPIKVPEIIKDLSDVSTSLNLDKENKILEWIS